MVSLAPAEGMAQMKISIDQTLKRCKDAGNGLVPGVQPIQSDLKKETSLIGMAYLNYIYQNDIDNRHFCEAMLLMSSQVPAGTANPYVGLFTRKRAVTTMAAAGTLLGVTAAGALIVGRGYAPIYLAIAATLAVLCATTLLGVKEKPLVEAPVPVRARDLAASFLLRGPRYRDFYFVLFTRALVTMGIYSVFTFFQFFLKDVVRVQNPTRAASYLIGIIIAAGIPTSLLAGALSDHFGRKPLVYWSGGLMAAASLLFIGVGLKPSLAAMLWIGALFGVGYGAYQAVDWALAIDVLPQGNSAAKDMGIWHVSLVLPQVIAPALTGVILSALKSRSLLLGYTVVFTSTALWFILGTVFVRQIRGAR